MKTNILVQYQGGGYDGCFWEWNYFYIDKQGTFHNIQSSGYAGIETLGEAQILLDGDRKHYVYNLNNKQDIETFSKESHPAHVFGVLQWFEDNEPDVGFFAICLACQGRITSYDDMVIENSDILCYECYCTGECPCCESYVGDDELEPVNPNEHYGYDFICSNCKEHHDQQRAKQVLEDLRFQSFCTGKPDMFSGELRRQRIENLTGGGI